MVPAAVRVKSQPSKPDPLDLVQRHFIPGTVVEPCGLRGLVGGDGARVLEGTAGGEVVGDAGGAEAVAG